MYAKKVYLKVLGPNIGLWNGFQLLWRHYECAVHDGWKWLVISPNGLISSRWIVTLQPGISSWLIFISTHVLSCLGRNSEISIPSPAILMIVVIQNHRPSLRFPVNDEDSLSQVSLFRSAVLSQLELHPSSGAFQSITLGCRITRYHQSC